MGRLTKKGLEYFAVDTSWETAVKLVKARYGSLEGVGFLVELWSSIYKENYFRTWTEEDEILFADEIKKPIEWVHDVIEYLFDKKLLDRDVYKEHKVLTSHGIQKRYFKAARDSLKRTNLDYLPGITYDEFLIEETDKNNLGGKADFPGGNRDFPGGKADKLRGKCNNRTEQNRTELNKRQTAESSMRDAEPADDGFGEDSGESALPHAAASYMIQEVRNTLASFGMSSSFSSREIESVSAYLAAHELDTSFVTWAIGKAREPSVRNPGGFLKSALTGRGDFADFPGRYREESRPQQQEQQRSRAPSTCPKCGKKLKATSDRAACKACGLMLEYDESLDDWAEADEGLAAGADQVLAAIGVRR